jgi:uncharacterized protein (DUF488 family)
MSTPFFTIGHSDRSLAEFVELLRRSAIQMVVDVRRLPGSNRFPQFNQDSLAASLAEEEIGYSWLDGLTGRRPKSKSVPAETNAWWENQSFHNYADYALSDDFRKAIMDLREQGHTRQLAVMCSEAVWWRCHRRIIADYLLAADEQVLHIMGGDRVDPAELSSGAVVQDDLGITYPPKG